MYRKSTTDDCMAIYELICDMERKELAYDKFSEIYHRQLNDRSYYCLVCEQGYKVIGFLNMRFEEQLHHAELIGEILEFSIAQDYRNKGIGKEMFAKCCEIAKEKGCSQIEVASNQLRKDAHRFYIREGMHNFHYKFSKKFTGNNYYENELGR